MSKIHVLERTDKTYRLVLHAPVPGASNAALFTWKSVLIKLGLTGKVSEAMDEGTGPGEITAAENALLLSGDVIEFTHSLLVHPGVTELAQLEADIDQFLAEKQDEIVAKYDQYGRVI